MDSSRSAPATFARDVSDTCIEIRYLIDQFGRYRVPPLKQGNPETSPELPAPDRVTPAWLYRHVTVGTWMSGIGLLFAAFLIGVAVARTEWYKALEAWIKQLFAT
jgi:hypothetical protein